MKKLINIKTQTDWVVFEEGSKPRFADEFLEKSLKTQGIVIPVGLRSEFGGRSVVRLGEPQFESAFTRIYFPAAMDSTVFKWVDDHALI